MILLALEVGHISGGKTMQNIVFFPMVSLIIWRSTSKIHEAGNVRRIGGKHAVEPLTFEKKNNGFNFPN
jgi:hypothetical protein